MKSHTYDYHQDADILEVFFADEEATAAEASNCTGTM